MTGQEEYPRFISNRPCGNDKYEGKSQEPRHSTKQPLLPPEIFFTTLYYLLIFSEIA